MGYGGNLLISIDQLGNVIAGGNPDSTISARIGYHTCGKRENRISKFSYWYFLQAIVDTTFYPIDGKKHCHNAYHNDSGESFDQGTKDWAIIILTVFILISCLCIGSILYILFLFGISSPKNIHRAKKVTERVSSVSQKLIGIGRELEEFSINDIENINSLKNEITKTVDTCLKINEQIQKIKSR